MGASSFIEFGKGGDPQEAFSDLCMHARNMYGNDPYNGTISTCRLGTVRKVAEQYSDAAKKQAYQIIQQEHNGDKYIAACLDLGVAEYEVRRVIKRIPKTTLPRPKWAMMYTVENVFGKSKGSFKTKTEAEQAAAKLALETGDNFFVKKAPVMISGGTSSVTEMHVDIKTQRVKPRFQPSEKQTYRPVHMYAFYGFAAE